MKKLAKHLALLFAVIFLTATFGMVLSSCDENNPGGETGLTLPPISTEATTTKNNANETTAEIVTTKATDATTTTEQIVTTSPPPTIEDGAYVNPLTGLKTLNSDPINSRPVAIVIDNIKNAYANQKGIGQADVLYEALVAPGITRYLAVVQDYEKLTTMCNVRSGRDYHIDLSMGHNAILVAHGGSITENYDFFALVIRKLGAKASHVLGDIDAYKFVNTKDEPMFSWADYTEKYGTIQNRHSRNDLAYDTVVNGTALKLVIAGSISSLYKKAGGTANGIPKGFTFASSGKANMSNALSATNVDVQFTCTGAVGTKFVEFKYDAASGKYVRYQDKKYSGAGEVLSFNNVIVLGTKVTDAQGTKEDPHISLVETVGSGSGYYFNNGKAIKINWRKSSDTAPLQFYLDGTFTPLELSVGNTYVGFVESSYVTSTFFD